MNTAATPQSVRPIEQLPNRARLNTPEANLAQTKTPARLLLIADDAAHLESLRVSLQDTQWQLQCVLAPNQLETLSTATPDLVVIDVLPNQLRAVLEAIRVLGGKLPILVEASRLPDDLSYAGLLPAYHAMPCWRASLLRLIKNRLKPKQPALQLHKQTHKLL